MSAITAAINLGSFSFAPERFSIRGGAYGSVGTCDITTSRLELAANKLDLAGQAIANNGILPMNIVISVGGQYSTIFGGEYVNARWDFDSDEVHIFGRDYAGLLVDEKRVISSAAQDLETALAPGEVAGKGLDNLNQTVASMVAQIAAQFGFTTNIQPNANADPSTQIGSLFGNPGDNTNYVPLPQSLWNVLNRLARDTGNAIYVTPSKELVFGPPGTLSPPLALSWGIVPPPGTLPTRGLSIQHNPRRNMTFRVLVNSYDPARAAVAIGEAYVIGTNFPGASGVDVEPGLWPGSQAFSAKFKNITIQLYTFHIDGLTQAQAQQRAISIAQDIAQREFIMTGTIDGYPLLAPLQSLTITGNVDQVFQGRTFFVQSYEHVYDMGSPQDQHPPGFDTKFAALDIQAFGVGNA